MYKNYEEILSVNLVSHSTPCLKNFSVLYDDQNKKTLSNIISYCARVSNPKNQLNVDTTEKLMKYLIKNRHWSPFDMVNVCLEVTTTRDIARQILRHSSMKFQEFSQRYSNPLEELEFCLKECRLQDDKNRQNSLEVNDESIKEYWRLTQTSLLDRIKDDYRTAINKGIAKEVARAILPEGNTVSRMDINGTIRSWIHYLEVRTEEGTQKEHRLVALEVMKAINEVFPQMYSILEGKKVCLVKTHPPV